MGEREATLGAEEIGSRDAEGDISIDAKFNRIKRDVWRIVPISYVTYLFGGYK